MTYKLQPHVCIVSVIASVIHIKSHAQVSQPSIRHSFMKRRNTCKELSSQVETCWILEKDSRLLSHILVVGVWWPWNKTHAPFTLDGKKKTPLTSVFDVAFAAFAHTSNDSLVVMGVYRLQLRSNGMKTQYPGWQVNSRLNISHHCSGKSDECCSLRLFENKFWRLLGVVRWGIWSGCFLFFIFDDEHDRSHLKKQKGKLVLWQGENHPFLRVYPWVKTNTMHNCFSEKVVSTIDCFSQESLARLKETLGGTRDSTGVVTVNSQVAAKAFILLNCRGYQSFAKSTMT